MEDRIADQPITLSDHARTQAARRGISEETVLTVAKQPEQVVMVRPDREIRQSRISFPPGDVICLVRVVIDVLPAGRVVVTVYRTSKIEKYWRT